MTQLRNPMEMETPDTSIMCVVENRDRVDYYVSDKKQFIEFEKRYQEKEKKWVGEKVGRFAKTIKPVCSSKVGSKASYIVFNSCLYRIGGIKGAQASRSVDFLDLEKKDKVWVKGPEMIQRRMKPYPVILDGQLYVVGGLLGVYCKKTILMEVMKRDGSGWEDIPNPPPYPNVPLYAEFLYGAKEEDQVKDCEEEVKEEDDDEYDDDVEGVKEKAFLRLYDEKQAKKDKAFLIYKRERSRYLDRVYESSRHLDRTSTKEIKVFIDVDDEDEDEDEIDDDEYICENTTKKEQNDCLYFRRVYNYAIVGAVNIEGKTVIVVGVNTGVPSHAQYTLYTYEAEDDVKKREWKSYTKIDLSDLRCLPEKSAVVSGELMMFIGGSHSHSHYGGSGLLFVLDFDKAKLYVFDLFEKIPDLRMNMCSKSPFLIEIEEGKFDIFWAMAGPKSKSKKTGFVVHSVSTVVSSSFILKKRSSILPSFFNTNTSLYFEVTNTLNWFSLLPDLESHMLSNVCFLPPASKHKLGFKDLTISSKIVSNPNLVL